MVLVHVQLSFQVQVLVLDTPQLAYNGYVPYNCTNFSQMQPSFCSTLLVDYLNTRVLQVVLLHCTVVLYQKCAMRSICIVKECQHRAAPVRYTHTLQLSDLTQPHDNTTLLRPTRSISYFMVQVVLLPLHKSCICT